MLQSDVGGMKCRMRRAPEGCQHEWEWGGWINQQANVRQLGQLCKLEVQRGGRKQQRSHSPDKGRRRAGRGRLLMLVDASGAALLPRPRHRPEEAARACLPPLLKLLAHALAAGKGLEVAVAAVAGNAALQASGRSSSSTKKLRR